MNHMQNMTCPKCRGAMTSYERSGVVVDQCTECRGIFLDRGELERLLDLTVGSPSVATPGAAMPTPAPAPDRSWRQQQPQHQEWNRSRSDWDDDSDSDRGHRSGSGGGSGGYPHKKSKRSSMLREFLDFG